EDVYDEVLRKAVELTEELTVGNPVDETYMGPVISKKQFDMIKGYIDIGKEEGTLKSGGETYESKGYFNKQSIFAVLDPKAVNMNTREKLIKAQKKFHVGNLYLIRGCTAAVMGYHPFGGFKLSGTDQKTGSPDYMLNFLEQKVVSEMF